MTAGVMLGCDQQKQKDAQWSGGGGGQSKSKLDRKSLSFLSSLLSSFFFWLVVDVDDDVVGIIKQPTNVIDCQSNEKGRRKEKDSWSCLSFVVSANPNS